MQESTHEVINLEAEGIGVPSFFFTLMSAL